MIITVKNLQQQTFTVEFEAEKTVLELKEKIFEERGPEYVVEKQKLIYAGVILDDERTIASYNVDEKKFVVVMLKRDLGGVPSKPDESGASVLTRSDQSTTCSSGNNTVDDSESEREVDIATADKGTATKSTEDKASGTVSATSGSDEDTKSVGSGGSDSSGGGAVLGPVGSNTSILSSGSGTSLLSGSSIGSGSSETSHSTYSSGDLAGVFSNTSLQSRAESNLLMGEEYNRSVESMIEMGYCREMVERAMAASFNNPERAVEYLISGIPENEDGFNASSSAAGESLLRGAGVGEGSAGVGEGSAGVAERSAGIGEGSTGAGDAGAQGDVARTGGGDGGGGDGPSNRIEIGGGEGVVAQRSAGGFGDAQPARSVEGGNVAAPTAAGDAPAIRGGDPFEFLRNQPQFLQMRSLVYQNPDLLHAVLQQIGQTNPALLQLISENQDAFLSMLNQPMEGQTGTNPQYPRRMTPGRRAQLAAAARAAAGGDGLHVRSLDTAPGAGGDGPPARQRPPESGDAGADTIPHDMLPPRPDRAAERRAAAADAFMRERAAAAAAVAALTAAASAAVERDAGGGEGGGVSSAAIPVEAATPTTTGTPATGGGGRLSAGGSGAPTSGSGGSGGDIGEVRTHIGPTGLNTIRLTTQDLDAIGRLTALGFPETLVLQAYFACDRDEQLAANFLISSNFDD